MSARRLDGAALASILRREVAEEIAARTRRGMSPPGLAVVLAGDDAASAVYVRTKRRACREVGIHSSIHRQPADTTTARLLEIVAGLNGNTEVDGILVQLPLPPGVERSSVLEAVDPRKDVDGFHPVNAGALAQGHPRLVPCTPAGVVELLRREGIPMAGARVVVLGRSLIVGRPLALLLVGEHATVTVAHSRTRNLPALCREADILVVAIGRPGFITESFVRPGATVIDVGINRLTDPEAVSDLFGPDAPQVDRLREKGSVLVGDVHPRRVSPVAGALTPVPGGIGPLTVAMLLKNTIIAATRRRESQPALHS
ncbi:MAG: bifunctional methylenetetrahydrofolate dehydrogenase/methenyltetrahydrofolate cyclohydrolase FolD [Acidobacteriota bacterium]